MNTNRLHEILRATTEQFRKGAAIEERREGAIDVTEVYAMRPKDAMADLEPVDMHFVTIGVNVEEAREARDELVGILNTYPDPDRLAGGPSYIEVGAVIGDQGAAFCLFALGKVLGLWDVITPERLGMEGETARQAAGSGYIMITGYQPATD